MDYLALRAELTTDPNGYGYAPYWANGQDWKLADLLNEIRDGILITRDIVPTHELFEAVVPSEWSAISAQEKERVQLILSMGEVSVKGANTRAAFQAAFGPTTTTRANLIALLTRRGSRAEQLFGTSVDWDDIAQARKV